MAFSRPEYNITGYTISLTEEHPVGIEVNVGESDFLYIRDVDDLSANVQISIQNQQNWIDARIGDRYDFRKNVDGEQRKFNVVFIKNTAGVGNIKFEVLSGVDLERVPRISADTILEQVLSSVVTVNTTAAALPAAGLTNRITLLIQNISGSNIWIGGASVTTVNGTRLEDGQSLSFSVIEQVDIYAVSTTTLSLRIIEGS